MEENEKAADSRLSRKHMVTLPIELNESHAMGKATAQFYTEKYNANIKIFKASVTSKTTPPIQNKYISVVLSVASIYQKIEELSIV